MLIWLIGWTEQHHLLRATWHHWEGAVAGFQTLQQGALGHKSWLTELSSYAVTKEAGTSVTKRPGLWQWQLMIYSSCIWFAVSSCYTSDVYVSFWDFFSFLSYPRNYAHCSSCCVYSSLKNCSLSNPWWPAKAPKQAARINSSPDKIFLNPNR